MLHIDRVSAQVDLLPADRSAASETPSHVTATSTDAAHRERLKALVFEVLQDHLRELERRGLV